MRSTLVHPAIAKMLVKEEECKRADKRTDSPMSERDTGFPAPSMRPAVSSTTPGERSTRIVSEGGMSCIN